MTTSALSLSLELVSFMDWLLKNKKNEIRLFVKAAVAQGLVAEKSFEEAKPTTISFYVQKIVMGLIEFLEEELVCELDGKNCESGNINKQFAMTIEHLDQSSFDPDAVWLSVQQAKSALLRGSSKGPREALLKNLLKNWHSQDEEAQC